MVSLLGGGHRYALAAHRGSRRVAEELDRFLCLAAQPVAQLRGAVLAPQAAQRGIEIDRVLLQLVEILMCCERVSMPSAKKRYHTAPRWPKWIASQSKGSI